MDNRHEYEELLDQVKSIKIKKRKEQKEKTGDINFVDKNKVE